MSGRAERIAEAGRVRDAAYDAAHAADAATAAAYAAYAAYLAALACIDKEYPGMSAEALSRAGLIAEAQWVRDTGNTGIEEAS